MIDFVLAIPDFSLYIDNIVDLWNLRQVNKESSQILKGPLVQKIIKILIRNKIRAKGLDPDKLDSMLIKTNSVLSGSFILQCLLNVAWENSDIDIFGKIKQNTIITDRKQILPEPIQKNVKTPIHQIESYFWKLYNENAGNKKEKLFFPYSKGNPENPYTSIIGYGYSRKYEYDRGDDKIVLNFIGTRKHPKKFVKNGFDLSIVRNYYDGKKMRIGFPMHIIRKIGKLMSFSDMGNFSNGKIDNSVRNRIDKYKSRGFHIKRHRTYDALLELSKFFKYDHVISKELPRNTRFHYKMPEKMTAEYFDRFRLESNSIQRIKIETSDHRYIILRFNRGQSDPLEILIAVQNRDDGRKRNMLTYAAHGTRSIVKQIRIREKLNPPIHVEFDYKKKELTSDQDYLPTTKMSLEEIAAIVDRNEF